jgi:hypothetical protein
MPRPLALETWLYLARDGETIDAVAVAREAKPDADPTANWTNAGIVTGHTYKSSGDNAKILRGNPGLVQVHDVIPLSHDVVHEFKMKDFSPILLELYMRAGGKITTTYQPGAMTVLPHFWIKVQQYDQKNQLVNAFDVYCAVSLSDPKTEQAKVVEVTLNCQELISTLNTGTMSNLS